MIARLSSKMADALVASGAVREEDREIYVYGMDVLLSTAANVLCVLAIGVLLGRALETLLFLAFFIPLRSAAGGYHADTHFGCFLILLCVYGGAAALSFALPAAAVRWAPAGLSAASLAAAALFAPAPHENRPVAPKELARFRKLSILLACAETAAVLLCALLGFSQPAFWASAGMAASAASLCAARLAGRRRGGSGRGGS